MERHMQVWLGRRVSPEHHSADWQAVVDSPRPWAPKAADTHIPLHAHCKLVAARQRVTVASIVDCAAMPVTGKLAGRGPGAGSPRTTWKPLQRSSAGASACTGGMKTCMMQCSALGSLQDSALLPQSVL